MSIEDAIRDFDVYVDAIVRQARADGHSIPCGEGCDACCYDMSLASEHDLVPIIETMRTWSKARLDIVWQAIEAWEKGLRRHGISAATKTPNTKAYHRAHVACPLLDEGRCSVYAARPLACRGHYVVNEKPSACANRARKPAVQCLDLRHLIVAVQVEQDITPRLEYLLPYMLRLAWPWITGERTDDFVSGVVASPACSATP